MTTPLRTAVIGVGYFGRFHAQKFAVLENVELVGVVDTRAEQAQQVAAECATIPYSDYRELFGKVDAVSIVVPTSLHHQVAKDFLEHGVHVLLEKPMTVTVAEADELIAIARANHLVLQIGHLERFNAAVLAVEPMLTQPMFIESHRLAPFNPRCADVSVILDLMIHDIDLIQNVVRSPIKQIDANGVAVLTEQHDIVNARITFESGCVANVTASRVSLRPQRRMRLFQPDAYVIIDFQDKTLSVHRKGSKEMFPGIPEITSEQSLFENSDAILTEVRAFIAAVGGGTEPLVSGEAGRQALDTAIRIGELLQSNRGAAL